MAQIFYHGNFTQEGFNEVKTILREKYQIMKSPDVSDAYTEGGVSYFNPEEINKTAVIVNETGPGMIVIETPSNRPILRGSKGEQILRELFKVLNPDEITNFDRNTKFRSVDDLVNSVNAKF